MIECHTDGQATRAGDVEAKNFKRADGSGATKKPKGDGTGGSRSERWRKTADVVRGGKGRVGGRGPRAQGARGRDTILAEALGAALPLHHC